MDLLFKDIQQKLELYPPQERGDHVFNPDLLPKQPYRDAAVLIPILKREGDYSVLFTKRTEHLHKHAGQVCFPGGGVDAVDDTIMAAALREAEEEVGLPIDNVEVLGTLDIYLTRTGFKVLPVVAFVTPPDEWRLDRFEVEEVFEVPLSYILTSGNLSKEKMKDQGVDRYYHLLKWEGFRIWGATAGILRNFVDVIIDE